MPQPHAASQSPREAQSYGLSPPGTQGAPTLLEKSLMTALPPRDAVLTGWVQARKWKTRIGSVEDTNGVV